MAVCRIFLFTYKRNILLPRAVQSILDQTLTDWVCEVHNDDPVDPFPVEFINSLNDSRFIVKNHHQNLGAVQSFNLAFSYCSEEFAAMLEDDNWWEPQFLQQAIATLSSYPQAQLLVGNERIWIEKPFNEWENTGCTVWPTDSGDIQFHYNSADKCGFSRICNSSSLWRTKNAMEWQTPNDIPIDVTEHYRERLIPHPIILLNTPYVNFAQTINTYRSNSLTLWSSYQVLLVTSVFENLKRGDAVKLSQELWARTRKNPFYKTTLLHSAFASKRAGVLFAQASFKDLFRYSLTILRNPLRWINTINAIRRHPTQWQYLIND